MEKIIEWENQKPSIKIPWKKIIVLDLEAYECKKKKIDDLDEWVDIILQINFEFKDDYLTQKNVIKLFKLMRILLSKCDFDANKFFTENVELERKYIELERNFHSIEFTSIENQKKYEKIFSQVEEEKKMLQKKIENEKRERKNVELELTNQIHRVEIFKNEIDQLKREKHTNEKNIADHNRIESLNEQLFSISKKEEIKSNEENHALVKKYYEVTEDLKHSKIEISNLQKNSALLTSNYETQLSQLKKNIDSLNKEISEISYSRDTAEALLQKREVQTLQDLEKMQHYHRLQIEEHEQRYNDLCEKYSRLQNSLVNLSIRDDKYLLTDIQNKDKSPIRSNKIRVFHSKQTKTRNDDDKLSNKKEDSSDNLESYQLKTSDDKSSTISSFSDENFCKKLQDNNDGLQNTIEDLKSEIQALELRLEFQDEENEKLNKQISLLEKGDSGIQILRNDLDQKERAISFLTHESEQLKERLTNSDTFFDLYKALKELCSRIGVTEKEISVLENNIIRQKKLFSERDIFLSEIQALKEEVAWAERERTYWMRKVRLQPVLDTKLRLQLGLTSDQLKQLDQIVEEMKSGGIIIDEESYRERYYTEIKKRQEEDRIFIQNLHEAVEKILKTGQYGDTPLGLSEVDVLEIFHRTRQTADFLPPNSQAQNMADEANIRENLLQNKLAEEQMLHKEDIAAIEKLQQNFKQLEEDYKRTKEDCAVYRSALAALTGISSDIVNNNLFENEKDSMPQFSEESFKRKMDSLVSAALSKKNFHEMAKDEDLNRITQILQKQLKSKDVRINELDEKNKQHSAEMNKLIKERDDGLVQIATLEKDIDLLKIAAEAASESADASEIKILSLEKAQKDLMNACSERLPSSTLELLKKIILLRQREGRLGQRIREMIAVRNRLEEQNNTSKVTFDIIREYLSVVTKDKNAEASFDSLEKKGVFKYIIPSKSGQISLEESLIHSIKEQVELLTNSNSDCLLVQDRAWLADARHIYKELIFQNASVEEKINTDILFDELRVVKAEKDAAVHKLKNSGHDLEELTSNYRRGFDTLREDGLFSSNSVELKDKQIELLDAALKEATSEIKQLRLIKQQKEGSEASNSPNGTDAEASQRYLNLIRHLEKQIAHYKSINFSLIQFAVDDQAVRKTLQLEIQGRDRELSLLRESTQSSVVAEFISTALRDITNLKKENELSQFLTKKLRLQLVVCETNFRVASNEATSYKVSAYNLFRSYINHAVKMMQMFRKMQRNYEGAVSARTAVLLHRKAADAYMHVKRVEQQIADSAIRQQELRSALDVLADELKLVQEKDPQLVSAARQEINTETRMKLRKIERRVVELETEQRNQSSVMKLKELALERLEKEASQFESAAQFSVFNDDFVQKLQLLHDTVFLKTTSPPVAVSSPSLATATSDGNSVANNSVSVRKIDSTPAGLNIDEKNPTDIMRAYREATQQQQSLERQCTVFQEEILRLRRSIANSEEQTADLRAELTHVNAQLVTTQSELQQERGHLKQHVERLKIAHKAQNDIFQRTMNHNTNALKEIISSKEKTISSLQSQLLTERQRFVQHQLMDTDKIEQLHEQMFRDNNAVVERFKATLFSTAEPMKDSQFTMQEDSRDSSNQDKLLQQLSELTVEVMKLREYNKDLKKQNLDAEARFNDYIAAAEKNTREALLTQQSKMINRIITTSEKLSTLPKNNTSSSEPASTNPMENPLYMLTQEQAAALKLLRQRETEVMKELSFQTAEVARLREALKIEKEARSLEADRILEKKLPEHTNYGQQQNIIAELKEQIFMLKRQLQNAQQETSVLLAQEVNMSAVLNSGAETTAEKKSIYDLKNEQVQSINIQNEKLVKELQRTRGQCTRLEGEVALLQQKLHSAEKQKDYTQSENTVCNERGTTTTNINFDYEANNTKRLAELQSKIIVLEKELDRVNERETITLRRGKEAQTVALQQHNLLLSKDALIRKLQKDIEQMALVHEQNVSATRKKNSNSQKNTVNVETQTWMFNSNLPASQSYNMNLQPSSLQPQPPSSPPPPVVFPDSFAAPENVNNSWNSIGNYQQPNKHYSYPEESRINSGLQMVSVGTQVITEPAPNFTVTALNSEFSQQAYANRSDEIVLFPPPPPSSPPPSPMTTTIEEDHIGSNTLQLKKTHAVEMVHTTNTIRALEKQLSAAYSTLARERVSHAKETDRLNGQVFNLQQKLRKLEAALKVERANFIVGNTKLREELLKKEQKMRAKYSISAGDISKQSQICVSVGTNTDNTTTEVIPKFMMASHPPRKISASSEKMRSYETIPSLRPEEYKPSNNSSIVKKDSFETKHSTADAGSMHSIQTLSEKEYSEINTEMSSYSRKPSSLCQTKSEGHPEEFKKKKLYSSDNKELPEVQRKLLEGINAVANVSRSHAKESVKSKRRDESHIESQDPSKPYHHEKKKAESQAESFNTIQKGQKKTGTISSLPYNFPSDEARTFALKSYNDSQYEKVALTSPTVNLSKYAPQHHAIHLHHSELFFKK